MYKCLSMHHLRYSALTCSYSPYFWRADGSAAHTACSHFAGSRAIALHTILFLAKYSTHCSPVPRLAPITPTSPMEPPSVPPPLLRRPLITSYAFFSFFRLLRWHKHSKKKNLSWLSPIFIQLQINIHLTVVLSVNRATQCMRGV